MSPIYFLEPVRGVYIIGLKFGVPVLVGVESIVKARFLSEKWLWIEQDKAVLITAKKGLARKIFVLDGANCQDFFRSLVKGVIISDDNPEALRLCKTLEKEGLITALEQIDPDNPEDTCPPAEGISLEVHDLRKILPSEIRVLTLTARKAAGDSQGPGNCNQTCGPNVTGCTYDIKLHYAVMKQPLNNKS